MINKTVFEVFSQLHASKQAFEESCIQEINLYKKKTIRYIRHLDNQITKTQKGSLTLNYLPTYPPVFPINASNEYFFM